MSSMSNVAGLSKYIRTFPSTKISIFCMIFISFITGVLLFFIGPYEELTILEKIFYGGAFGFGAFGLSSIIGGALSQQLISSMKAINLKTKHSMLLALLSMILVVVIAIIGAIISAIFQIDILTNSVLFGCVLVFAFLIFVFWSTSSIGLFKSAIVACLQPLLILSMLVVVFFIGNAEQVFEFGILSLFVKVIVANIIFLLAIYSFVAVIESPMRKNLGIGLLDLVSLFISHLGEGNGSLEKIFEDIGEPIDTLVGIVSFRRKNNLNDNLENLESNSNFDNIKSLFISPCVHPGPIGSIGGSNMPTILANRFNNFTMVAHGPSTHDFNPVSQNEINKVEKTIKDSLNKISYGDKASKFVKYSEGKAKIGVQFFNDSMVMLSTFAPFGSDDIEFSVGLAMMSQSKKQCNVESSIIVDCHNSFNEEKGRVLPGNPEVFELLDTIDKVKCKKTEKGINVGCAENLMEDLDKNNGIGESGLKLMVIEVQNQRTAYILLDSNNMELGFREEIINAIKSDVGLMINDIEVMTTDTHFVNTLSNGYNPIGVTKREEIIDYINSTIKEAIIDLEPVEVGCSVERIEGLNTFGPNNSVELVSTISSIVAVSRIMAPIIFILAILFVFVWIFYLPGI
jgi:putative membrane protein